jgi:hypothetical protein
MSAKQLTHSWDDTKTGRTRHVFELPSNKPMCGKAVERATVRRHVKKYLNCVQCLAIASKLNEAISGASDQAAAWDLPQLDKIPMPPKPAPSLFDEVTKGFNYQKMFAKMGDKQVRLPCDDRNGELAVMLAVDGDMHLAVYPASQTQLQPGFRARTYGGGGRHERVRKALMILAVAMIEDGKL